MPCKSDVLLAHPGGCGSPLAVDRAEHDQGTLEHWSALQASGERAVAFRRTIELCQHRLTELKDYINSIFQSVMAHRFRCPSGPRTIWLTDASKTCSSVTSVNLSCLPCHFVDQRRCQAAASCEDRT